MNNDNPVVSIVIPCHNSESTIKKTISSVLSQTYSNLEIIIYNNYSSDLTENLVLKYRDPRIKYYKSKSLLSMSQSWTTATKLGTGTYLLLLCSDDLLQENAISILLEEFFSNTKLVQVIGRRKLITLNGFLEIRSPFQRIKKKVILQNKDVIRKVVHSGSNPFGETLVVLFKRVSLTSCLPWSEKYFAHIDVDMYLRISRLGDSLLTPEIVGKWRFGSPKSSTSQSKDLFVKEFRELIFENYLHSNMKLSTPLLISALTKSRVKQIIRQSIVKSVAFLKL